MKTKPIHWIKCHHRYQGYVSNFYLFQIRIVEEEKRETDFNFDLEVQEATPTVLRTWYQLSAQNLLGNTFQHLDNLYCESLADAQQQADLLLAEFVRYYEGNFRLVESTRTLTGFIGYRRLFELTLFKRAYIGEEKEYPQLVLELEGVFNAAFCQFGRAPVISVGAALEECINIQRAFLQLFTESTDGLALSAMPELPERTRTRFQLRTELGRV